MKAYFLMSHRRFIVWTEWLLHKLRFLPVLLFLTLKSFLSQRTFAVCCDDETSNIHPIDAVYLKERLELTLYNIFTSDISHSLNTPAKFADDTVILFSNPNSNYTSKTFQYHLDQLQNWFKLWKIKINEKKSTHVTFTLWFINGLPLSNNNNIILQKVNTIYLGICLDKKLN